MISYTIYIYSSCGALLYLNKTPIHAKRRKNRNIFTNQKTTVAPSIVFKSGFEIRSNTHSLHPLNGIHRPSKMVADSDPLSQQVAGVIQNRNKHLNPQHFGAKMAVLEAWYCVPPAPCWDSLSSGRYA